MHDEQEHRQPVSRHAEVFGLTYHEDLFDTLNDGRLNTLINDPNCDVLEVSVSSNSFGEYLFVTFRKLVHSQPFCITAYGLGFHEQRERWITNHWRWYWTQAQAGILLSKRRVLDTIRQRRDDIASYVEAPMPSERAMMFSLLADVSDEDGALTELEDLGWTLFDDSDKEGNE